MIRAAKLAPATALAVMAAAVLAQTAAAFAPAGAGALRTSGSTDEGAVTTQARTVTLTLAPRNASGLRAFDAKAGHAPLSPAQFAERYAPSAASVAAVESWASAHGLQTSGVSPDDLLVSLAGTTGALGSALGVSFDRFHATDGSSYVSSKGTASLPSSLSKTVTAITGLSDLARVQTDLVRRSGAATPGLSFPASYGPKELNSLYGASSAQTGGGQTCP